MQYFHDVNSSNLITWPNRVLRRVLTSLFVGGDEMTLSFKCRSQIVTMQLDEKDSNRKLTLPAMEYSYPV